MLSMDCIMVKRFVGDAKRLMNCRAKPGQAYEPTEVEHLANCVTHGLWVMPSVAAAIWMMWLAHSGTQFIIALVYGLALIILFSVSTTFHTISYSGKCSSLKNVFHIGDRAVIYIFIAASYTPWLTLKNFGGWGTHILWTVWLAAALGITYQYTFHERYKGLETLFYVILGVCPSVAVFAMDEFSGIFEVAIGGLIYIIGVIFFKCDGILPFAHAIWHCFVIAGTLFHCYAVCNYLLGPQKNVIEGT